MNWLRRLVKAIDNKRQYRLIEIIEGTVTESGMTVFSRTFAVPRNGLYIMVPIQDPALEKTGAKVQIGIYQWRLFRKRVVDAS